MCVRVNETCHQQPSRAPQNTWQKSSQLSATRLSLQPVSSKEAHMRQRIPHFTSLGTSFNHFSAFDVWVCNLTKTLSQSLGKTEQVFSTLCLLTSLDSATRHGVSEAKCSREECMQLSKCKQIHLHPLEITCSTWKTVQIRGVY